MTTRDRETEMEMLRMFADSEDEEFSERQTYGTYLEDLDRYGN